MDSILKDLRDLTQALRDKVQAGERAADRPTTEAVQAPVATSAVPDPNEERWAALLGAGVKNPTDARDLERQEKLYGRGVLFGRVIRAIGASALRKDFSREAPVRTLRDVFRDQPMAQLMERALSIGTPSEGGYLVSEILGTDLIPLLYDRCVIMQLGARTVPMPEGNLTLPRVTAGSTFSYKSENAQTNSSQPSLGDVKWAAKKLTGNIPVSNDLLRVGSSPLADALVRDDALQGMAVARDRAGFLGGASPDEPVGVFYDSGVTPVSIGAVVDGDNVVKFLKALLDAKVSLEGGGSFGWGFNPTVWMALYNLKFTNGYIFRDEMNQGKLLGFPYGRTTLIPNGSDGHATTKVAFGNWAEYLIAQQGAMEAAVSTEAAYYDAEGVLQSAWGKDQTVMRFIEKHDMKLRLASAMGVSTDVYTVA